MEAIEYIKNGLEKLSNQFPHVQIRYAFNYEINIHIIQFDPIDAYYNLPELDAAWIPFSVEFDRIFADESIAFIGSDSILSIVDNYEFSWNLHHIDLTFQYYKELLALTDYREFVNILPETINWTPTLLTNCNFLINPTKLNVTLYSMNHFFFENSVNSHDVSIQEVFENIDLVESEKYAMAA
jgi:hypothetical protein